MGSPNSSSSGEEDGPAEWLQAIESVVATTSFGLTKGSLNGSKTTPSKPTSHPTSNTEYDYEEDQQHKPQKLTHYNVKAQKLLDGILEKSLEVVRGPAYVPDSEVNGGGVRLFRHSAPGIVFDRNDELKGPRKKPRILPGKEIDMTSTKFRRQLQSVVVDGVDILAAAKDASQKSLTRLEAKEAAAKARAKREEERVAELKRIRGERWLPSIAREMQLKGKAGHGYR